VSFLASFATATWMLICESAPFLLLGFFLAGLIKALIPTDKIQRHLGENRFRSVLRASMYGVPLPLCSCSVIPTATSLRKNGASKGATAAFMISTPETGVDSIGVSWALLDPIMTVARPCAAFLSALVTGSLVNILARRESSTTAEPIATAAAGPPAVASCCDTTVEAETMPAGRTPFPSRMREAAGYGYGPLLDDLTPWFVIGFLLSGLIATVTPANMFADSLPSGLPAMGLMLIVGLPLYVCATASTPIAAVLIAKGLSPGAALVFLLVGPATNVTTLMVVRNLLGRGVLAIYLAGIVSVALAAGFLIDWLYPLLGIDLSLIVGELMAHEPGIIAKVAGVILLSLILNSARRIGLVSRWKRGLLPPSSDAPEEEPASAPAPKDETKIAR
jgi:uncharacterized membrane protein YraQ (UPF0718 family)